MPQNIDNMIKQYKKVAFIEKTLNRSDSSYDNGVGCRFYNIKPNVNFKITKAIIFWDYKTAYENKITKIRHTISSEFDSMDESDNTIYRKIQIKSDNSLKAYMADSYGNDQILTRMILIGE